MSAELELRVPLIRIRVEDDSSGGDQAAALRQEKGGCQASGGDDGDEECRTPTGEEHKIPAVVQCPPAPRKALSGSCKRKFSSERRFLEIVAREEVEAFFKAGFELAAAAGVDSGGSAKRRHFF